jgi:hypothetical protein
MNENLNKMIADSEGIVPKAEQQEEIDNSSVAPETAPEQADKAEESFADRFAEGQEREDLRDRMESALNKEQASDRLKQVTDQFSAEILKADSFASLYSILDTAKERGLSELGGVNIDEVRADLELLVASSEGPAERRLDEQLLTIILEKTFPLAVARAKIVELYKKNSKETDDFEKRRTAASQMGEQSRAA